MKSQKQKINSDSKEGPIITEEDRSNNPIFKIIYKRVRNLNKKLTHINALLQQDQSTLKPEQLQKIQAKPEVEAEIAKNQEFALFYKNILVENGGVLFDNTEQIMKLATFLAVGSHANTSSLSPSSKISPILEDYRKITGKKGNSSQNIPEKTASIFTSLNQYLGDSKKYELCRDYISDIAEKQENGQQQQKAPEVSQKKQQSRPQSNADEQINQEELQLEQESRIEDEKNNQNLSKIQVEPKKDTDQKHQVHPQKQQEKHQQVQSVSQTQTVPKQEENPKAENDGRKRGNRGYKENNNQPNKNKYNSGYNNNYNKNSRNGNRYNNDRGWQNKNHNEQKKYQARQKSNDTSLESTPQKLKPQKPKYIPKQ